MKPKVVNFLRLAALVCLLSGLVSAPSFGQSRGFTVTGKVIDSQSLPVIGAGVTIKGTTTGVATGIDGDFSIVVPNETAVLVASSLGYVTKEVAVTRGEMVIVLEEDSESLEATVVVAYGTQKKATVTGALTTIDSKALVKAPVADVTNVLAGQMPGVSTVQESGQPGEDYAKIYIRGVGSLNESASTPLILVDGVERPINTVDPNEIESLSILKDAASTAVFGVRGANGVIIVTTKRGDAGKPKISVSSITGLQVPLSYITQCSSYDFARYYNVYKENDGITETAQYFTPEAIEAYRTGSDPLMFPNTNWNEVMFRKAFMQTKNNINISGGSDKVRYFVSMGYMYQDGLLKQIPGVDYDNNYAYNRYNYRANLDFKLTETTDMKFNISGVIGDTQEPIFEGHDNVWMLTMLWAHPTSSPGVVDGYPVVTVDKHAVGEGLTLWNGWEYYYKTGYTNKYKTTLGMDMSLTQRLDFITEGLSVGVKGSYDTSMSITKKHSGGSGLHMKVHYASWADDSGLSISDPDFDKTYVYEISGDETPLSYSESHDDDKSWYLEGRIDYNRRFAGKHSVSGLLLYNQSRDYYPSKYEWLPRGYVGLVGRVTYGYMDKYLVDVSAGYNGSENFAPGKTRYGFFPSISLGWVLSEEPWMKKVSWLDYLKLRASIGKVGNDLGSSARFMYMEGVWNEDGAYYFGVNNSDGVPRYSMGTPGNMGVTWETSLKSNIGVDFDMLRKRLHFSGDIFKEHRTGILISPKSLPAIISTSLPNMNLGVVDNHGYEFEVGWRDHAGDFYYDIDANVTFARNKIIFMDEVEPSEPYQAQTLGPTNRHLLYQFERLYQKSDFYTDADGVQRLNPDLPQPSTTVYPGDAMYADLNGDGKVNGLDAKYDGYPDRPEYVFGSNWKFNWKGFNLSLNWIAATNVNRVYNQDYRIPFTNSGHRGLLQIFADNCWIDNDNSWAPGREDGTLPRFTKTNYPWNSLDSTLWTVDASYLRLKSASFGYTFARNKFFDKLGIGSVGLMFTGYNLLTLSRMKIQDPEAKSSDSDGTYPLVKTYNLALNINF
ncbi:MAG: TonB-dependent receptor [Bacteroidales bacterium]|nr:TonB-dependent receptor [Bacteroidales bacterium]